MFHPSPPRLFFLIIKTVTACQHSTWSRKIKVVSSESNKEMEALLSVWDIPDFREPLRLPLVEESWPPSTHCRQQPGCFCADLTTVSLTSPISMSQSVICTIGETHPALCSSRADVLAVSAQPPLLPGQLQRQMLLMAWQVELLSAGER